MKKLLGEPPIAPERLEDLKVGIDSYEAMRPHRPHVVAALRKLLLKSPRQLESLMKIWVQGVDTGAIPVEEPYVKPNYSDSESEHFYPTTAVWVGGAVRRSYRSCGECDGNGWHFFRYPNGHEACRRCSACSKDYGEFLKKRAREKKKEAKWEE